jgi:phenylacetate-coenzyme A ligase PaaK-like adenylate-forming protein
MLYRFGKFESQSLATAEEALSLLDEARAKTWSLATTPVAEIVDIIDRVGKLWRPGGRYFERALREVSSEISFSPAMIEQTLRIIPALCEKESLRRRLVIEFGDPAVLDRFVSRPGYAGRVHAAPFGTLLHVAAGNVFIGCIDSLINGFVTKNVSIMKLSGRNLRFPILFAESVIEADPEKRIADKFALVYWPGGKGEIESVFKNKVNAIIAWGGQEMLESYRKGLGTGVTLIEHGPKISFQVIFKKAYDKKVAQIDGLAELAQAIATDVSLWDQSACSSPQNLFVEAGIDNNALMSEIGRALEQMPWKRGMLSGDEHVEILKERSRATYDELMGEGAILEGQDWMISLDPESDLRSSPLNRCLIVKRFSGVENLGSQVMPYSAFLQTCGYLADGPDHEALLARGALWGLARLAPIGQMMTGLEGSPHDGRYGWAELTRLISDEMVLEMSLDERSEKDFLAFVNQAIQEVPVYGELYSHRPIQSLRELRPIVSGLFAERSLLHSDDLLKKSPDPGYVFSSGGTSGNPKFAYYSYDEFDAVGKMLARGFRAQGLERGTLCANLFVAGNLWSSFLAIDRALAECGACMLPIGGNADPDLILKYLSDFKPRFVIGLPSLLVSLVHHANARGIELEVPQICYAGEHLNSQARKLFEKNWKTKKFGSAGYASVDAGPIGYQCDHCAPGEHHLFSEYVHMEIVDDEAVVTSKVRRNMPVIHLRTGDHVSWGEQERACPCGDSAPKFYLHGRCDGQMNLWSCRLLLSEVEDALVQAGIDEPTYQVSIEDVQKEGVLIELLTVSIETKTGEGYEKLSPSFAAHLHRLSKDVHVTHPARYVEERVALRAVAQGSLQRVARTGKIPRIVDLRK